MGIMNIIRQLRLQARVTQQVLAQRAGTSQSAIAAYEVGKKSPTLRTLEKLASAVNLDVETRFVPRLTRVERRSLAYHQAVADVLRMDPEKTIQRARSHVARLQTLHPHAAALTSLWRLWLDLPPDLLIAEFTGTSELAREMRQVSPFAGVLPAQQRKLILASFRQDEVA
jgi:transcriptional regulator with XRE-family HTH domain